MPCLGGDICCPSCGPAQGNFHCRQCGRWESDGGCVNPAECLRLEAAAADAEAAAYLELDRLEA